MTYDARLITLPILARALDGHLAAPVSGRG